MSTIANISSTIETRQKRSRQLALAAARTAEDHNGQDIAVLDMRGMTTEFDFFVLVTGNSRRQLHAISEEIDRVLESELARSAAWASRATTRAAGFCSTTVRS